MSLRETVACSAPPLINPPFRFPCASAPVLACACQGCVPSSTFSATAISSDTYVVLLFVQRRCTACVFALFPGESPPGSRAVATSWGTGWAIPFARQGRGRGEATGEGEVRGGGAAQHPSVSLSLSLTHTHTHPTNDILHPAEPVSVAQEPAQERKGRLTSYAGLSLSLSRKGDPVRLPTTPDHVDPIRCKGSPQRR